MTGAPASRSTAEKTWTTQNNQPTAQFYHVAVDKRISVSHLRRAAGQLERLHREPDRFRSDRSRGLVSGRRWRVRVRDSRPARLAHHLFKQRGLHRALQQDQRRRPGHQSDADGQFRARRGRSRASLPVGLASSAFAAQSRCHLHRRGMRFKSADHGQSWTRISEDLTRNDKTKQQPSAAR